jgi:hypothetical protein
MRSKSIRNRERNWKVEGMFVGSCVAILFTVCRLTYDAALNKVERLKGSKKEKDREEAEEEMEVAKTR